MSSQPAYASFRGVLIGGGDRSPAAADFVRTGLAVDNFTALQIEGGTATVLGRGRVTVHLWRGPELIELEFHTDDLFSLELLAA